MAQGMRHGQAGSDSGKMVTCWNLLPGTAVCLTGHPMGVDVSRSWVKEIVIAYMSGSGAPRGLVFWAAWWAGRDHRQLCDGSAPSHGCRQNFGDAAALDVLALPQLALLARSLACHFRLARFLHQPPPPQTVRTACPNFFCTLAEQARSTLFPKRTCRSKIDLLVRSCQNHLPQSPKQPQPREVQPLISSTTALPNFATTTSPSHRPQSWRPLTCPAFSTPPARTLSCSWPPSPTSAPRTCRFT